jgi:hypothetical protein
VLFVAEGDEDVWGALYRLGCPSHGGRKPPRANSNPALTAMANAIRVDEHILERMK